MAVHDPRNNGDDPDEPPVTVTQILYTINQAARALAIGRTKTYQLLKRGELESIYVDGARRIEIEAVQDYVRRRRDVASRRRRHEQNRADQARPRRRATRFAKRRAYRSPRPRPSR